jgi:Mor family transcriptional regulator
MDWKMDEKVVRDGPELLVNLCEVISRQVREAGLDWETADTVALAVVESMAEQWGGQSVYFPKGSHAQMRLRKRDLDIYREFTGHNHADLAARYGVSKVWVYAIVRRLREEIRKHGTQVDLF